MPFDEFQNKLERDRSNSHPSYPNSLSPKTPNKLNDFDNQSIEVVMVDDEDQLIGGFDNSLGRQM